MTQSLEELLSQPGRPRILVLGDVMVDRYVWGDVERISPEAPIPVLKVDRSEDRLGGAGNVATMLAALATDVTLLGVVGDDDERTRVVEMLAEAGIATDSVVRAADRVTTVKQRLLGGAHSHHPQQMIRMDRETASPVDGATAEQLLACLRRDFDRVAAVVVSDYGKGVCGDTILAETIRLGRKAGVPVVVDPAPRANYTRYRGSTCITPNRTEAGGALGRAIDSPEAGLAAAEDLLAFGIDSVMVTLDRDGIAWADSRGNRRLFPVHAREVCDITGAGDMVAAAFSCAMALGADWAEACQFANVAAGLEVQRLGVVALPRETLLAEWRAKSAPVGSASLAETPSKKVGLDALLVELRRRRDDGQRIVMTNGCFDLLHPGHVASLEFARRQGDCLVVGLNSDRSVRRLKGPQRPLVDERDRAAMLAALACVDYVVVFDETSVAPLVGRILPDVLVKSAQYAESEVVGHEIVEAHGGRIVRCPIEGEYSTTRLIERIAQAASRPNHARKEAA
ncbi:MAG TPA: bifunctional heptose 7-phosphate kinase/heptose 1-phosphate adenyltransferase [Thermoguttaceae bacterium]|nr:bifunctional heptose 7-phosphate kinase/heptose 1-phosphate adenyltransferase [Thermoguttaceae bacterium]